MAVLAVSRAAAEKCRSTMATLEVHTRSNGTGHWNASLSLQQRSAVGSRSPSPLRLRAEPSVTVCDGVRTDELFVTLEGPPPPPSPGYTYFPGVGSYKLHTTKTSWAAAKDACEGEGAHLVVINSEEEAAALRELIKRHTGLSTWLFVGFSDQAKEGTYLTIFGEPIADAGYTKWGPGQPDDHKGNEDCGSISHTATLNDLPCAATVEFICEQ